MGRYNTQVTICDYTSCAQYTCRQTCTVSQGTCVFQMSGGISGCGTCGPGVGTCCLWCVPQGVSSVMIEIWGGGGGGGAAPNCVCQTQGSGGGGGSYARKNLQVVSGACYTICVAPGGAGGGLIGGMTASAVCCCGMKGGTTFITGPGLSNFCAEGGYGGESRQSNASSKVSPNGGWPGTGGDLNLRGGDGGQHVGNTWINGFSWGGQAPFGGRQAYIGYDACALYSDWGNTGYYGGVCGFVGNFPGGGGTGGFASCCCGVCACGGNGAPGAIRIWM